MELESVIEDSIGDASMESTEEVVQETQEDNATPEVTEQESSQVATPATQTPVEEDDEDTTFSKKYGIPSQSIPGRENRIPYSRVKKIVGKAEADAAKWRKDAETFGPKITEFETKIQDYEGRLQKVAEFEHIIENDPQRFLGMLAGIPAYKEFFDYVQQLSALAQQVQGQQAGQTYLDHSSMPQPDQVLQDGSRVYSLEGLAKRDEWLAKQVEEKALKAAEDRISKRYAPMEERWQAQQRVEQMRPVIEKQIAEARTWPGFTENEADIIEVLKADPNISLDGAWRKVYLPKVQQSREEQRKGILDELKKTPMTTSAPTSATRPNPPKQGNRSLEDIINEEIQKLK